jgi:hypothetical protein
MNASIIEAASDWFTAYVGVTRIGDFSTRAAAEKALRRLGHIV